MHRHVHIDQWQTLSVDTIVAGHLANEMGRVEELLLRHNHLTPVGGATLEDNLRVFVEILAYDEQLYAAFEITLTQ